MSDRTTIAAQANAASNGSRRPGAPRLTADSDRGAVICWLQWNDPNGCHTDALAIGEDFDPYTDSGAWEALETMLRDC